MLKTTPYAERIQAFFLKGLDDESSVEHAALKARYPELVAAKNALHANLQTMEALALPEGGVDALNQAHARERTTALMILAAMGATTIGAGGLGYYLSSGSSLPMQVLSTAGATLAGGAVSVLGAGALAPHALTMPQNQEKMHETDAQGRILEKKFNRELRVALDDITANPWVIDAAQSADSMRFRDLAKPAKSCKPCLLGR